MYDVDTASIGRRSFPRDVLHKNFLTGTDVAEDHWSSAYTEPNMGILHVDVRSSEKMMTAADALVDHCTRLRLLPSGTDQKQETTALQYAKYSRKTAYPVHIQMTREIPSFQ